MHCKILLSGCLAFLLSGCSLLSPVKSEPVHNYVLSPAIPMAAAFKHQTGNTLLVTQMQSTAAYNTSQIAYSTQPYQVAYFAENRWATKPAQMLQLLIVQTLQKTHAFHAVITPPVVSHYDLILVTQLLQLQQDFLTHPSQVHLQINAQLIDANKNQVIATRQFCVTEIAPQDNPYGGVLAANRATADVLRQLAIWVVN